MSKPQTVIIAPDIATAEALYAVAPKGLLAAPDKTLADESGRVAWIHHDWPAGFTDQAARLGCKVVAYETAAGTRWDAGNREAFTPKMEAR